MLYAIAVGLCASAMGLVLAAVGAMIIELVRRKPR